MLSDAEKRQMYSPPLLGRWAIVPRKPLTPAKGHTQYIRRGGIGVRLRNIVCP
jgi:hypothetical protein